MMRRGGRTSQREPTIPLINIVFLMLVFFMVAGRLAQPLDPGLKLIDTRDPDGLILTDVLVLHADGRLSFQGTTLPNAAAYLAGMEPGQRDAVRIAPDRDLPAQKLVSVGQDLRRAGAGRVVIVAERRAE